MQCDGHEYNRRSLFSNKIHRGRHAPFRKKTCHRHQAQIKVGIVLEREGATNEKC